MSVLRDSQDSQALASASRMKVLQTVLALGPGIELAHAAEHLGGHPNGTRRHLEALAEEGLVEVTTRKTSQSGRPAKVYTITDAGRRVEAETRVSATQGQVLGILAKYMAADGDGARKAREIGQAWGLREAGKDAVQALRTQGFAPARGDNDGEIILLSCPMRDAVRADAKVTCSLHHGFLEGVLSGEGAEVELIPFGSPRGCVVRIIDKKSDDS